jgi:glycosyltransferase involved in cell wall biosynthesis
VNISVIIPVFRGEATLQKLFEGIRENLKSFVSFEVLFVYDRGPDNSWEVLKELKKKFPDEIRIFKLKRNYGQHNAILFGISKSESDLIVTMDEDLQHDPGYIVPLLEMQRKNHYEVVYGRFHDSKHNFFRKIASAILRRTLKFLIPGMGYYSSYRVITRETAAKIALRTNTYTFIDANLIRVTSEIGYLDIDHLENTIRQTSYNFIRLASHAIQILLAYTKIAKCLMMISAILVVIDAVLTISGLIGEAGIISILFAAIVSFIIGKSADLYHKWEIRNNLLPIVSIETD